MTDKTLDEKNTDALTRSGFYRALPVPALVVIFFLFLLPLVSTLSQAFRGSDGGFSLELIISAVTSPYTIRLLGMSLLQATASTVASFAIGMPGAYILATYSFPGKKLVRSIGTIPFVLPSILVVLGFVIFYGNNGLLNRILMSITGTTEPLIRILYSFPAIILAHAFFNFPVFMNIVSSFWESMDRRVEDAAMTLGAPRKRVFRSITLPRLVPSIISAATLVFLFCFSSFAVILVLGGGPRYSTLEVEIYRASRSLDAIGQAAAMSLLSLFIMLILLAVHSYAQRQAANREKPAPYATRTTSPATTGRKIALAAYSVVTGIFVLAPMLGIVYRSFRSPLSRAGGEAFSLRWYREIFRLAASNGLMASGWEAVVNSLIIAIVVALVTVPLAVSIATFLRRKNPGATSLELAAMLPMAVSSVIIGLGYFLIRSRFQSPGAAYVLVVLAHVIIAIPFVMRSVLPDYRRIPPSLSHAAMTMGASPSRVFFSLEVPLLRNSMVTGGIFAFAISMGEINATLTLSDSTFSTIPLVMYRLIGSYNYQGACALGTLLISVCVIVFFVSESLRRKPA
ncbi:ABC transporter permease [Parasphaerochaeta coccoides]|uniref:Binding-protein-dependent transport systems inner membrane component n=1 Tax=Parasphaerochaeta coccoides (strain ATCC BAA-1237 / DSM 17374 / SPN1) TaxID=760011 RepID=F4GIN1_PARC1|nr:iron ABC transporter permease [Parasphaerochaeta coccoides]AEC02165.1 binding-protein-dependent transport systems inner membrane component [Parasphaerochaeta coccoides DSM 17374]